MPQWLELPAAQQRQIRASQKGVRSYIIPTGIRADCNDSTPDFSNLSPAGMAGMLSLGIELWFARSSKSTNSGAGMLCN
jgi:hypothetical protein